MMGFGLLVGNARGGGLDRVMQAMESDYQALSRALFREDYVEAKKAAERLASHPTPGFAEKLTLLARLGTAAGRFQELDSQVKETARDISSAADARAFDRMATGFERLTDRCLSCHSRFGTHANLDASD
ncbi:hypothetical protein [Arhodomonas sp. KWT]|nr:hypothetical protein [Arhodomonas sp. KWT]